MVEKLLTIGETAALLGINIGKFYRMRARGLGPRVVHVGNSDRYTENLIREWVAGNTGEVGSTRDAKAQKTKPLPGSLSRSELRAHIPKNVYRLYGRNVEVSR
jgi:predicted DNA-binding transcriptional regulator AlpA